MPMINGHGMSIVGSVPSMRARANQHSIASLGATLVGCECGEFTFVGLGGVDVYDTEGYIEHVGNYEYIHKDNLIRVASGVGANIMMTTFNDVMYYDGLVFKMVSSGIGQWKQHERINNIMIRMTTGRDARMDVKIDEEGNIFCEEIRY